MVTHKLTEDLKKLASAQMAEFTKQLNAYEKKARGLIKELDSRSKDAREKGKARFEELVLQLKKTRSEVETKVRALIEEESKRLNGRVAEIFESLRSVGPLDGQGAVETKPAKAAARKTTARKKATGTRKTTKKSRASHNENASTTTH